ncbi:MAG: PDZ domain-containing protein [Proteobacteria bacterium]|nr:PDZ domain-containing protein [Pseudomonadota bacterium]
MDNVVAEETTDDFAGVPPSVQPPTSYPKWPWIVAGVLIAIGVIIALAWPITVPYYTLSPGPVYDTSDFVTVDGGTVSGDGELFFLTVSLKEANIFEYAAAQIDPRVDIRERETVRPIGVSPEQLRRESLAAMSQSQQDAIFVALTQLGYEVTLIGTGALVIDTVPDAAADGILLPNDIIVEMNGEVVAFRDDIINQLGALEIGDVVEMMIERQDEDSEDSEDFDDLSVEIVLGPHVDDPTKPMIGILLDNNTPIVEFPVDVVIESQNIGGPSAGMMFTLQIMDQLTPGELTNGERIAGTGTIARDGTVGPIGGIKQKIYGAIDAGARAVLVPASNYDDAVLAAGDDIEVVRIETIEDSLDFLATL